MLVILPLITGGALHKLLSTVGIRLPAELERMMGGQQMRTAERFYSRGGARDFGGGSALPGMGGGIGSSIGAIAGIAKVRPLSLRIPVVFWTATAIPLSMTIHANGDPQMFI